MVNFLAPTAILVALVSAPRAAEPQFSQQPSTKNKCGLTEVSGQRAFHEQTAARAVQIIRRALAAASDDDPVLSQMVSDLAQFSLGGGDVVVPLGTGVAGARALARRMEADSYRYLGWDYVDGPADVCGTSSVEVEFVDSRRKHVSIVKFSFAEGKLIQASGWTRSFQTGPLRARSR